jgi:hypothetical protein
MAQALEKVFKGKVVQMPKDEVKIETATNKTVKKKPPKPPSGTFVGGIPPSPAISITKPQQATPAKQISNLEQSFVLPSETSGAGLSTPKASVPISSTPDVQSNLHNLINQQATPANASQIPTSSAPFLVNQQPAMNTVPVSAQQPAKVKKGVKRKADTTTPTAMGFNESSDVKALRGRQVIKLF